MSFNLLLIRQSCRVLAFSLNFTCMAKGGVNWKKIPPQQIDANTCSKGGLIIEGGIMSSGYSIYAHVLFTLNFELSCYGE